MFFGMYRQNVNTLVKKLALMHLFLTGDVPFQLTVQHDETISGKNEVYRKPLISSRSFLTKKAKNEKCDACGHDTGFFLLIEDYTNDETGEAKKSPRWPSSPKNSPQSKCH